MVRERDEMNEFLFSFFSSFCQHYVCCSLAMNSESITKERRGDGEGDLFSSFTAYKPFSFASRIQFYQHLLTNFLYESVLRSFSLVTFWLCNFLAQKYWRKMLG